MLPVPNIENYNQQMSNIQSQLAQFKAPQFVTNPVPISPPSQVKYVDGIKGDE